MATNLEEIFAIVDTLSKPDLRVVQNRISERLNRNHPKVDLSKISFRLSPEKIEAQLAEIFTPEELADIDESELDDFPTLPKTITEYISEDREDRL